MQDSPVTSYDYEDFSTVVEKKAYHGSLLARGIPPRDRRPRKHPRSSTELVLRLARFRVLVVTIGKWLGVFVGGCVIGSALTLVFQGRPTMGRAGIQVAVGFAMLAMAIVLGRLSRTRSHSPA